MEATSRLKSIFEEAAKVSGKILENEENVRAYATALEIAEKKLERNKERLAILMSEADRIYRGEHGDYPRFVHEFDLGQIIEKKYPKNFFYTKREAPEGNGCYTCVDNSLGEARTEEFESIEDIFKFFFGEDAEEIRNGE